MHETGAKVVEYSKDDLEYLKRVYDRFGRSASRGGVNADEYRALKDAGMLDGTSAADAEPERTAEPEPAAKPTDGRTRPEVRENILAIIKNLADTGQEPTIRRIAKEANLTGPTIQYHLNQLQKEHLIVKDKQSQHWMPAGYETASRSKRELILDYCLQRLGNGQPVTAKETAQALGLKPKTCSNIIGRLRNEGLLPAAEPTTPPKPKPKPKPAFKPKEKHMPDNNPQDTPSDHQELTADTAPTHADRAEQALEDAGRQQTQTENTAVPTATCEPDASAPAEDSAAIGRRAIAYRLGTLHNAMLDVLSASFTANDKVAYAYACKLLSGEIMDLKSNYSKDAK